MNTTQGNDLGRAAFWMTNVALSQLLSAAYPTGCTLAEAITWAGGLTAEQVEECEAVS